MKKRKETTREPFGWFSGLSIAQSLALDLRRMEVLAFTVFVGREMTAIIKIACGALLDTFPGGEGFRADRVVRPYKDLLLWQKRTEWVQKILNIHSTSY